jgi:chromosome segregation ATPase
MEMDEFIFDALEAIDEKWTAHAADGSENTNSDIAEMKEKMTRQSEQIASQQEQITSQQENLRKLREIVEKLQDSQAAAAKAASDSESVSDCEGETKAHQMEQTDEITMPFDGEQNMQEPRAAADTPDSHLESDTEEDLQE